MPPFAYGVDSISRVLQDPDHADNSRVVVVAAAAAAVVIDHRESSPEPISPTQYTNLLKINEQHKEEEEELQVQVQVQVIGSTCGDQQQQQIADVLQFPHILHDVRSPESPNAALAAGEWRNLCLSFEEKSLNVASSPEEDREQLGSLLLSGPTPRAGSTMGRKRSLSSMLESESDLLRSCTSSESNPEVELEHNRSSRSTPSKVAKTERLSSYSNCKIDKDLLSLSLPNSMHSESSSSSRESDHHHQRQQLQERNSVDNIHAHPRFEFDEEDGSDRQFDARSPDSNTPVASFLNQVRGPDHDHANQHQHRALSAVDDAAGDTSIAFAEAATVAVRLALQVENNQVHNVNKPSFPSSGTGLRHEVRSSARGALHPLRGLDASRLNEHSLLMLDAETGLEAHGLQLVHLLLKCADATAKDNMEVAARILAELYQGASLYGDSMQRVAAYFAEGLAARIVDKDSPMYSSLMVQPSTEEYLSAFTTLYKVAPYFQFAHFTANQAILEALEGQNSVHVIDLDIMQGFQWPSLIQALASRPGGPPHLRITGVGKHGDILQETGRRLASFAESFDVSFEFHSLVEENLECLTPESFSPRSGEATAVNSILQLHRLLNPPTGEKLHKFIWSLCRKLNPYVVTIVEQEANHNASTFLGRFMEALHYYAAVFDSLDASLPQQNEERVKIEQLFYAQQIKNIVACDGDERIERHETVDLWQKKMEMAGFYQVPLSSYAISQAKLLLQFCPCEGYRLHERNGSISLGWKERQLLTASAWSC